MQISENELVENHKRFLERIELYRQHGYDFDLERSFVIEKALPISGNILEAGTGKGYFPGSGTGGVSLYDLRYFRVRAALCQIESCILRPDASCSLRPG